MAKVPMANRRLVALVDEEDLALVVGFTWSAYRIGRSLYAMSEKDGRRIYMHRLIAGEPGLELANQRPQLGRSSRFKGVSWYRRRNRWEASIKVHGRKRRIGYFDDEVAAARAYDAAAIAEWGEYARPNFPVAA
jgi:hypothetical protein